MNNFTSVTGHVGNEGFRRVSASVVLYQDARMMLGKPTLIVLSFR